MRRAQARGNALLPLIIFTFFVVGGIAFFSPELIAPFRFFEFWTIKGSLLQVVKNAWPLYAWGTGITFIILCFKYRDLYGEDASKFIYFGTLISAYAGLFEEVGYRWLIFLFAIIFVPFIDWLLFGFMDLHWIRWLYEVVLCPIANYFTFGYLKEYLIGGNGWAVGAAIISANSSFRDAHKHLGPLGFVNSWFLGMYLFWVTLNFGLIPAILIHFLYDFFIFLTNGIMTLLVNTGRRR